MQPIFVTGIGRSGTSALLKCLVYHESVLEPKILGEAPFMSHFVSFLKGYENHPERNYRLKNYKIDEAARSDLFGDMLFKLHILPRREVDLENEDIKHWPAKAFPTQANIGTFEAIFTDLKIFYIIRNGVEVVNSTRNFHGFSSLSFEECCRRWAISIQVNAFLETRANVAFIKHHELLKNPHKVLGKAFESLKMKPDDGPADYISQNIFNSSFDATGASEDAATQFSNRLQSAWDAWTTEEKDTFDEICGPYMKSYGFNLPKGYKRRSKPPTAEKPDAEKVMERTPAKLTNSPTSAILKSLVNRPKLSGDLDNKIQSFMPSDIANYCLHTSLEHKFTYVEVPKTGCTTVKFLVQSVEYANQGGIPDDRKEVGPFVHYRNKSPLPMFWRMSESNKKASLSGKKIFRFTFVRNPYSRALSCYKSKIEVGLFPKRILVGLRDGVKPEDADISEPMSFREYLELVKRQKIVDMDIHWRPQVDQMMIGLIKYDFIGRYENFSADLSHVMDKISPKGFEYEIPKAINKTKASAEMEIYYNADCMKLVREIYKNDFIAFQYDPEKLG